MYSCPPPNAAFSARPLATQPPPSTDQTARSAGCRERVYDHPPRRFPFAAVACGLMFGATVGGFGGCFSSCNLSSFCRCGFLGAKSGIPRGDFFFMGHDLHFSQTFVCQYVIRTTVPATTSPERRPPSSRSALRSPPHPHVPLSSRARRGIYGLPSTDRAPAASAGRLDAQRCPGLQCLARLGRHIAAVECIA